jgi:hypothetical protein
LGIRLGSPPRGRHQRTTDPPGRLSKQDISTLLGIGHFYFALTGCELGHLKCNRGVDGWVI